MNNSDAPAMPVSNDVISEMSDFCVTQSTGLTKREMFTLNAPPCPDWYDSNQEDAIRFIRWPVFYADLILKELEK